MEEKKKVVWRFTNGIELNEKEFIRYFEKKVFKTIRRFEMLKNHSSNVIEIENKNDLNTKVLNHVLSTKFITKESSKGFFSSLNLTDLTEKIFENILKGKFKGKTISSLKAPLCFLSDKEIYLYANLKRIEGETKKRNKRIQELFSKFFNKNPDLEHNIIKAYMQINEKTEY